jgi:hypothetical protein
MYEEEVKKVLLEKHLLSLVRKGIGHEDEVLTLLACRIPLPGGASRVHRGARVVDLVLPS